MTDTVVEGSGIDFAVKLSASIDTLSHEIRQQRRSEQERLAALPVYWPLAGAIQLDSSGNGLIDLDGPKQGRQWIVRLLTAVPGGYTATVNTGAATTGAAGAATSVNAPTGTTVVTGFDVNIGPATAAGTVTVTLSNVAGGPYTYYIDELTTQSESLSKTLNLLATGVPQLSVSALLNGGIVSLNLYVQTGTVPMDIAWSVGKRLTNTNTPVPATMTRARMRQAPAELSYTSDVIKLVQNENLLVGAQGGTPNGLIIASAYVLDQPAFGGRPVTVES